MQERFKMESSKLIEGIEQWMKITRAMTEAFGDDVANQHSCGFARLKHYRR